VETWDAIRARRNVREYTDQPISEANLHHVLEAARRTPSANNRQAWDFILVTGRDALTELAKTWPQGGTHIARAQAAIVLIAPVMSEDQVGLVQYDLGQATMSIMLAATDLGIGTGHAVVRDQDLAKQLLDLPDDRFAAYMIGLGYPSDRALRPIRNPNRRAFDEVVHRQRW